MRKVEPQRPGAMIRCAIYTRKSSDEGLEQEFNSLDAQREACAAYIVSQKQAGWVVLPDVYDDGGISGGTLERPALQRLLGDIQAGKVQIVVVYKVDRLTRSLADFAKIVDVLDAHDASFVSVTQQFNTTTSMGRLTLNMLLSFAQFEREIAGERIRDKIAASKAKGMWMGGNVPLGYDVQDRKLVVNEVEAATVRLIFRRYAELGSVRLLAIDLERLGIVSKRRQGAAGRLSGGQRFSRGALYTLLQNRIYRGEITHKGKAFPGQHAPIIEPELWQIVQDRLAANRHERALAIAAEASSLLAGLVVDGDGNRMTPTHANKRGKRYRYYVSAPLIGGDYTKAPHGLRVPAGEVDGLVLDQLRALLVSRADLAHAMAPVDVDACTLEGALHRAASMAERWAALPPVEVRSLVRQVVARVVVAADQIGLCISPFKLAEALGARHSSGGSRLPTVVLSIAASLRRAGKEKRLVIAGSDEAEVNAGLVALMRDALAVRHSLLSGSDDSIEAMTVRLGVSTGYISALVRLSYLAPSIVRACLDGRQPVELTPTRLLSSSKDLPHDWNEQRRFLGFGAAAQPLTAEKRS
jgi:DNA invertase Pin-like site-specific DNA recombinase